MPTEAQQALNDAIANAEEQLLGQIDEGKSTNTNEETTVGTEETVESDGTEGTEEAPGQTGEELTEDQIKEAKTLYNLLLDPRQRKNIIAALAQDSGLLNEIPLKTEKQVEKAEKSIADLIKEALPEFPGLTEKLGPVIEKIVQTERDQREQEAQAQHLISVENEVTNELNILARETKGSSRKVENKMAALMSEVQPGPNVSVKSYVRTLYTLATAGSTKQNVSAEISDKIRRNANNAADRLQTGGGRAPTNEMPTKKMNLNDSVNWAIQQAFNNANGKK